MDNKKVFIISFSIILIGVIICSILVLIKNDNNKELPIYRSSATYLHDTSTPENAIGDAAYAFIAKINGINRTEYRNPVQMETDAAGTKSKTVYGPYTIYDITVIENLKGNLVLNQSIELEQMGGIGENKEAYYFPEGTNLLNIGEYYIILAYAPFENGNIQINRASSIISLGNINEEAKIQNIKNICQASSTDKIDELQTVTINNTNSNNEVIDKVIEYKKASLNPTVFEENLGHNKSKYDEYYMNMNN